MSAGETVSFLIAGVQKGGTSALFDYLRDSPAVRMPAVKEAHFFDDETVDWSAPDPTAYHRLFGDGDGLWGEATPIYLYWPNSLERIARYNPAMKIVVLFRDPIQRAWSHWKMEYAKRKECEPFAWCIREGRARLADADPQAPGHHRVFSYVERGLYARQTERLFALFPREQCLLLRSEDLRDDPAPQLARLSAFLGIPALPSTSKRVVHVARSIDYPSRLTLEDQHLLADIYLQEMKRFESISGIDASLWTSKWL